MIVMGETHREVVAPLYQLISRILYANSPRYVRAARGPTLTFEAVVNPIAEDNYMSTEALLRTRPRIKEGVVRGYLYKPCRREVVFWENCRPKKLVLISTMFSIWSVSRRCARRLWCQWSPSALVPQDRTGRRYPRGDFRRVWRG